jgi:hypothetical protein
VTASPPAPPSPDRTVVNHGQPAIPSPAAALNELRLTLPRAVAERLEDLERRLEKLETFSTGQSRPRAATDRPAPTGHTP